MENKNPEGKTHNPGTYKSAFLADVARERTGVKHARILQCI